MSRRPRIYKYQSISRLARKLREDLNNTTKRLDLILLYAYNRTGKTRLSVDFKNAGRRNGINRDTLYFNAFTEDLFTWDNDLDDDRDRVLIINSSSSFFSGIAEMEMENRIRPFLQRYVDFDFRIDYENWTISFSREVQGITFDNIKVSRGEENIFIWCFFLALVQLAIDGAEAYNWVKYIYIDDPISSLDDNNAIAVACDLAQLLKQSNELFKTVISTHHSLFYNVIWNDFRRSNVKHKTYFYHRPNNSEEYTLQETGDTPFFHHVAMLNELKQAADSDLLYAHHFNTLRTILEKTAVFFGFTKFSDCIHGADDENLYSRALNLLSHGGNSIYEPTEMVGDTKELFKEILSAFLDRYHFDLPELTSEESTEEN
jgi:hypothetical protein